MRHAYQQIGHEPEKAGPRLARHARLAGPRALDHARAAVGPAREPRREYQRGRDDAQPAGERGPLARKFTTAVSPSHLPRLARPHARLELLDEVESRRPICTRPEPRQRRAEAQEGHDVAALRPGTASCGVLWCGAVAALAAAQQGARLLTHRALDRCAAPCPPWGANRALRGCLAARGPRTAPVLRAEREFACENPAARLTLRPLAGVIRTPPVSQPTTSSGIRRRRTCVLARGARKPSSDSNLLRTDYQSSDVVRLVLLEEVLERRLVVRLLLGRRLRGRRALRRARVGHHARDGHDHT